jgi:hypothetical protein
VTRRHVWWLAAGLAALLLLAVAVFHFVGREAETTAVLSRPTGGGDKPFAEESAGRAAFLMSSMSACTKAMTGAMAGQADAKPRFSDDQIKSYCHCYSYGMADVVTADEVQQMMSGAPSMDVVREKTQKIASGCLPQLQSK